MNTLDQKINIVESHILNVIVDYNTIWDSHEATRDGIRDYAKKIVEDIENSKPETDESKITEGTTE
jgi:hypothetical protein